MRVNRKIGFSGVAGAITVMFMWLYGAVQHALDFSYPLGEETASAFTTIVMFITGYMTSSDTDNREEVFQDAAQAAAWDAAESRRDT